MYSNVQDVREMSGNIIQTEFPDLEIQKECDAADSWINTKTHKSDWDASDIQYNLIIKIANKKATEFVLEHYGPEFLDKVKDLREECDLLMADIVENMPATETTGLDQTIIHEVSDYESYPLALQDNPNATPYISTETSYII